MTITMIRKTKLAFTLLYVSSLVVSIAAFHGAAGTSIGPSSYYGPPAANAYNYGINTTYLYTYNFSATNHDSSPQNKKLWIPSLSNRTLLDSSGKIYQQQCKILYEHNDSLASKKDFNLTSDANGNSIYFFNFTVPGHGTWSFDLKANFTLRQITWNPMPGITMASYNKSDPMYTLYTKAETQINKSYPAIASEAASLNTSNPYATVKKVYNFVTSYLTYNYSMTGDYGAEYAIDHHYGDCTEFSYLMTALLRACGIPARVLRGIVIASSTGDTASPNFQAPVGTSWTFTGMYDGSTNNDNSTGHAWCEYFIPGQGWIIADPTWHLADNYTAKIDNVHVPFMVNLWIGNSSGPYPVLPNGGGVTNPTNDISFIPYPMYDSDPFRYDISSKFTVIQQEIPPQCDIICWLTHNLYLVLGIIIVIAIIAVVAYVASKRRSKSSEAHYYQRANFG